MILDKHRGQPVYMHACIFVFTYGLEAVVMNKMLVKITILKFPKQRQPKQIGISSTGVPFPLNWHFSSHVIVVLSCQDTSKRVQLVTIFFLQHRHLSPKSLTKITNSVTAYPKWTQTNHLEVNRKPTNPIANPPRDSVPQLVDEFMEHFWLIARHQLAIDIFSP